MAASTQLVHGGEETERTLRGSQVTDEHEADGVCAVTHFLSRSEQLGVPPVREEDDSVRRDAEDPFSLLESLDGDARHSIGP
jgi:hypothetical protein